MFIPEIPVIISIYCIWSAESESCTTHLQLALGSKVSYRVESKVQIKNLLFGKLLESIY